MEVFEARWKKQQRTKVQDNIKGKELVEFFWVELMPVWINE
jgi:hypothetical protein